MKRKTFTIILTSLSMFAMAQQQEQQTPKFLDHYTLITAGVSGMQFHSNEDARFDIDMFAPGATIGFTCGSKLVESLEQECATYIEIGAELSYNTGTKRSDDVFDDFDTRIDITSLTVPVSLCYKSIISPRNYRFAMFGGISPKENLVATMTYHYTGYDEREYERDMFSEAKMGADYTAKHFEFGVHVGLGFEFDNVSVRYKCAFALTPFQSYTYRDEDVRTQTVSHLLCISYILGR